MLSTERHPTVATIPTPDEPLPVLPINVGAVPIVLSDTANTANRDASPATRTAAHVPPHGPRGTAAVPPFAGGDVGVASGGKEIAESASTAPREPTRRAQLPATTTPWRFGVSRSNSAPIPMLSTPSRGPAHKAEGPRRGRLWRRAAEPSDKIAVAVPHYWRQRQSGQAFVV